MLQEAVSSLLTAMPPLWYNTSVTPRGGDNLRNLLRAIVWLIVILAICFISLPIHIIGKRSKY